VLVCCSRFSIFLLALVLNACATLLPTTTTTPPVAARLAIMQGVTGSDYTQVLVLTQGERGYRFVLVDARGKERSPHDIEVSRHASSAWRVQRVAFQGLTAHTAYRLRVYQHDELLDERRLRTLKSAPRKLRLAVAACMNDHTPQGDIWQQLLALRPEVVFLIGDNVYADLYIKGRKYGTESWQVMATPAELWRRNVETRNYIALFKSEELVPVVATWDDHDYGINNGGRDYLYKQESLAVFDAFFASQPSAHYRRAGLGTAAFFSIYGFNFFLLDNRSFRTVKATARAQQHYGRKQLQWLWHNLRGKDYALLVGGDQFFGGYHRFDSFEGSNRKAFARFQAKLKTLATKVAFISGDRHLTEIMRIPATQLGYRTYEFTTSPIHAQLHPSNWDKTPNPRQIAGQDLHHNFMLLELERSATGLHMHAASYSEGGKLLFRGDYMLR